MKDKIFLILFLMVFLILSAIDGFAVEDSKQPVEISAKQSLEWDKNNNKYIAKEDVIVKYGDVNIFSDLLEAYYNSGSASPNNISKIVVTGNVKIASGAYTAYGNRAVYEVKDNYIIMTGDNLKIETEEEIITARDFIEYDVNAKKFTASGMAKITRAKQELTANKIIAELKAVDSTSGTLELKRAIAIGNVIIDTQTEKIKGDKAVYNAKTKIAEMTGKMVTLEQNMNILQGSKVKINLNTGISKIFAPQQNDNKNSRVRGVFYPE